MAQEQKRMTSFSTLLSGTLTFDQESSLGEPSVGVPVRHSCVSLMGTVPVSISSSRE